MEKKMRPGLVTGITIGFIAVVTIVLSIAVINGEKVKQDKEAEIERAKVRQEVVNKNMEMGDAEEGVLLDKDGNPVQPSTGEINIEENEEKNQQ